MTRPDNRFFKFFITVSIALSLLTLGLTIYKYPALPQKIPLFYSHLWGLKQLSPRSLIFLPIGLQLLTILGALRIKNGTTDEFVGRLVLSAAGVGNIATNLAVLRILNLAAFLKPWPSFLSLSLILPFIVAFLVSVLTTPPTISLANLFGLVDDPTIRKHPAMLQKHAIPRAGAVPIFLGFALAIILIVPLSKPVLGIFFGSLVCLFTGLIDDKRDLNPYLRFFLSNILAAGIVIVAGVGIAYFKIPVFEKVVDLGAINFNFWGHNITLLADIFDLIWIVWVMNMLNWSKGVDGQFPGIVIIAALTLGILSLKIAPADPTQKTIAQIAFSAAGATLGFLIFNWHPSKILPGYGTTFLGLILATLSIYSGAKVAIALLVLLVPTLDAIAAILRRVLRGQSPFWHDREHLHHRLLNRGLSHQQIAYFYWGVTGLCSLVALFTAGRQKMLAFLTIGGIAAFALAIANLKSIFRKPKNTPAPQTN